MPKIDIDQMPLYEGTGYPPPMDERCKLRSARLLSRGMGLDKVGVNLMTVPPGQWSSQRHWHDDEDEFVWVVSGEVVLVEDGGETILRAGDCAAWKAGVADGHHLQNRSDRDAVLLQVGNPTDPATETVDYPDLDLIIRPGGEGYRRRDGSLYPAKA
ncbi:cupin domain-containing protein [Caulobacter mirabilis]|uniref:Transcriptional regulator n=1 Tax=Caulobacter mirabilis TaxID=69666 RepID=A0A2D2AU75_9CAUL|nr:cupin domain-containing protein [Caulobacter mirabilis]ATQ41523.1 transcriptional regulator [Caulobacter mirabilis]